MLTALWLVLMMLNAGTTAPGTHRQASGAPAIQEPVIIIVK